MRIVTDKFSTFYDRETRAQFNPILDRRTGLLVGMAEVSREDGELLRQRSGFRVVENAEFITMTCPPELPQPAAPETGDPLTDQSAVSGRPSAAKASGPPPPPPSK